MPKKASTKKKATTRKAAGSKASAKKATTAPKEAAGKAAARPKAAKKAASKKAASKAAPKKTPPKKAPAKPSASKKAPARKTAAAKPASAAKAAGTSSAKKPAAKKPVTKKAAAKKAPSAKAAPKKAASKKVAVKKSSAKKPTKAATGKASGSKKASGKAAKPGTGTADDGKPNRKGITIVTKKKIVRRPPAPKGRPSLPPPTGSIMGMGLGGGRPLIPSSNTPAALAGADGADGKKVKSPFNKRQLDRFREVLHRKRRELLGDIDSMENEALKSDSGASSGLPQHMADQGSDAYDQTLSLNLAAADRTMLKEIDAALDRIAAKTFGVCEQTGRPISKERLDELPWARFSIEAAREMERRGR